MLFKRIIRALLPAGLLSFYHWLIAWVVALVCGLPGKRLFIIGVTGTKGKTSTASMLWHILENQGYKTALISTAFFALGQDTKLNNLKMTMPGRFKLQKFLQQAVKSGCQYAIIETSSEGLAQWRHVGLAYKLAIFTNLAPEHLEAHGSFEKYKRAKARLFKKIAKCKGMAVINLDDEAADYFIKASGNKVLGYTLKNKIKSGIEKIFSAQLSQATANEVAFLLNQVRVSLPVGGEVNAYNALAAIVAAEALGVYIDKSATAIKSYPGTPGRMEYVAKSPFSVVVDYAHTVESLESVYKTLKGKGRLIAVLGSCGGGRDKAKRAPLGKLAGQYADCVIVTDEDPYDENPRSIMEAVAIGVKESGKKEGENYWIIEDRRDAIHKALSLAQAGDTVIITGKGAEQWLMQAGGKKLPWDDRRVIKEQLADLEKN